MPTHTLKIAIIDTSEFDGTFTFELFRRSAAQRLPVLAPLRYQQVEIPFKLHHPMWLQDCAIDLDSHLRRATVRSPGGRRELDDLIGDIACKTLDRGRPLWEVHFVEGMAGNRFALIAKVHHALADGVASANLLARAMDPQATAEECLDVGICTRPSPGTLLRAAGRDHYAQLKQLPAVVKDTAVGVTRMRRRVRERGAHPELGRGSSPPATFINHRLSPGRRFATATLALAEAKQTSKRLGITINDLVLAFCAGALRELLLRRDGSSDKPIIASIPVNTDPSPDRISGNALGALIVSLPVHIDDPLKRVRLIKLAAGIAKENNQLLGPDLIGRWINYLPPPIAGPALRRLATRDAQNKLYNVSISNVRGPSQRGHIAGATMSELYSVGPPTPGSGLNVTVWSYVDQLNISVLADDVTLPDAHDATEAMLHEFAEIRRAAGLSSKLTALAGPMAQAEGTH